MYIFVVISVSKYYLMLKMKTIFAIFAFSFMTISSVGQDKMIRTLDEFKKDKLQVVHNRQVSIEYAVQKYELKHNATPSVAIKHYKEHEIAADELPEGNNPPSKYIPNTKVAVSSKVPIAYVSCNIYRKDEGKYYKLDQITYDIQETAPNVSRKTTGNRSYAANSELTWGDWYKISVDQDGVYALDYNFLTNELGLNLSSINANRIQIFGNGGHMLSWDNKIFPKDDLQELPIKLMDGGDGVIHAGDKILFYANGPDSKYWDFDLNIQRHKKNKFEDRSYYFIRIGGDVSKRITNRNINTFDKTTSTVYEHVYRERDSTIIDLVGGYWLGDAIGGSQTQRNWSFTTHSPDNDSLITITTILDYHSTTNTGNLSLTVDGTPLYQGNFSAHGVDYYDPVVSSKIVHNTISNRSSINLGLSLTSGSFSDRGYLKSLDITIPSRINGNAGTPFIFSDARSAATALSVKYEMQGNVANKEIWDVGDIHETESLSIQNAAGNPYFIAYADSNSKMVLVQPNTDGMMPTYIGTVENQNLHAHNADDLIIVTHKNFMSQAEELATYRIQKGMSAKVVLLDQIYNEFSSGSQDPVAIKDYMKMLYDKSTSSADAPRNLLLMGDASFDYKNRVYETGNTNYVPTAETEHIVRINSFNTDDFFAFLDDDENPLDNEPKGLDIGVGRIPCNSVEQASRMISKIKHYESPSSFGNWKLKNVYLADNADPSGSAHMQDAERISDSVFTVNPLPNTLKAYGDAYPLVSSGGGSRIPAFNQQINQYVNQGALIINYNGHGGYKGLGQEGFLTLNDINSWRNPNNLPIFITATCDFSKFDFPDLESAGEKVLINNNSGGIALVTTTQAVYRSANRVMNTDYLVDQFKMNADKLPSLGEAWMVAKNDYFNGSPNIGTSYNYQKFALLGDPSMSPSFPYHRVIIDSITNLSTGDLVDTLQARGRYTMYGHLEDFDGNLLENYSGLVTPSIYDKPKTYSTVYQYPTIPIRQFTSRNSIVYKGNANVTQGTFKTNFILPKDIQYQYGIAKISSYAFNSEEDAGGANFEYILGGEDTTIAPDNESPLLEAYLDDENFVNGGITSKDPVLLLFLEDISGINTSGSSIGHDMVAVLDDDPSSTYILNDYYTATPGDYTKGTVNYPLYDIEAGLHHLDIKVWDGANNSASTRLDFEVLSQDDLELRHVYNYPNPFMTSTNFMFEHNFPNELLHIKLNIYSPSGKLIQSIQRETLATGTRIDDISWDGKDNMGDHIGNGVYYYTLQVKTESGKSAKKLEKLYIIK